jgi:hypothetical protein
MDLHLLRKEMDALRVMNANLRLEINTVKVTVNILSRRLGEHLEESSRGTGDMPPSLSLKPPRGLRRTI